MPIDDFQKIDDEYFNTILEEDFFFEGDIKTQDALLVKGSIKGSVEQSSLCCTAGFQHLGFIPVILTLASRPVGINLCYFKPPSL